MKSEQLLLGWVYFLSTAVQFFCNCTWIVLQEQPLWLCFFICHFFRSHSEPNLALWNLSVCNSQVFIYIPPPLPFLFFWIRRLGLCFVFLSEMICSTAPSGHLIWSVTWCLNIDADHQHARKLHLFKFRLCLDENLWVNRIIIILMRNSNYFSEVTVRCSL